MNNYVIYDGFFSSNNNDPDGSASDGVGKGLHGGPPPGARRARIYMGKLQYI